MNCKQGDLAYVFKSDAGNYGRIVTCLALHPAGHLIFMSASAQFGRLTSK